MIKGKLVGLRAIEKEDLALLKEWRNIPTFRRNFREYRELNMVNQENWFAKVNASNNDFMFLIERLQDKTSIGAGGLLYINWVTRSGDFSFYIGHDEAYVDNSGYAQDAATLLLDYGFNSLNLNKIWMELFEFDYSKQNFFKNFGFQQDGRLRENCYKDGRYWDSFILSLLQRDYKAK